MLRSGFACRKTLIIFIVLVLTGLLGAGGDGAAGPPVAPVSLQAVPPPVAQALAAAAAAGDETVAIDALLSPGESMEQAAQAVAQMGGRVTYTQPESGYMQIHLPPTALPDLLRTVAVSDVGVNFRVGVNTASLPVMVPADDAPSGFRANLDAIRSQELVNAGVNGLGSVIAIIDTGVDPGHPAFGTAFAGRTKLIDWQDFSGEGDVVTNIPVRAGGDTVQVIMPRTGGRPGATVTYGTKGIRSLSGVFWFGLVREAALAGGDLPGLDLDHNGRYTDSYGVLVVDSHVAGVYDTVYVDTNRSRNFADKTPLNPWRDGSQGIAYFGIPPAAGRQDLRTPFVLAAVAASGQKVTLGFDANGHGTHVASIAAAYNPAGLQGVAPGAQVMAIKALDNLGDGYWHNLVQALYYAATNGADVVSISLEHLERATGNGQLAARVLSDIATRYGVVLVLAGGNSGPGLTSVTPAGDPADVITVGGYYSPAMWQRDYSYLLPEEIVWLSSAAGPRFDGGLAPTLIAPVAAPAAVPYWLSATGYGFFQGTSQAVPHVSGVAALLVASAKTLGATANHLQIKQALESGAAALNGFAIYEQGRGLLNAPGALARLQGKGTWPAVQVKGPAGGIGVLSRNGELGRAELTLINSGPSLRLSASAAVGWMQPERQVVSIPGGGSRQLGVKLMPPAEPGIYSAFLTLSGAGTELQVPHTIVVPHRFDHEDRIDIFRAGQLSGRHRREFFQVLPGTAQVILHMEVPSDAETLRPRGRIRYMVFDPDGNQIYGSPSLGVGDPVIPIDAFQINSPRPGIWEVFIQIDPQLAEFVPGAVTSDYRLGIERRGFSFAAGLQMAFSYSRGGTAVTASVEVTGNLPDGVRATAAAAGWGQPQVVEGYFPEMALSTLEHNISVREPVPLARFEVFAAYPTDAAVGLRLKRYNPQIGDYETVLVQPGPGAGAAAGGDGPRVLEVQNLEPGTYLVSVDVAPIWARPDLFYRRTFFGGAGGVKPASAPVSLQGRGSWQIPLTFDLPPVPGRYEAQLLFKDSVRGQIIAWLPMIVSVGQPRLTLRSRAPNLALGEAGQIVLEVIDETAGKPIEGPIQVNNRVFMLQAGAAEIPVLPTAESISMAVWVDQPGFRPLAAQLTFQVGERHRIVPAIPSEYATENSAWRQKVEQLLGQKH